MASGPITPPPYGDIKTLPNSFQMWYLRVKDYTNSIATAVIPWAQVDKSGSNLTDLTTRNHNDLTNIFGGTSADYYHLTASQYNSVVTLNTITALTTLGSSNGYVLCDATAGAFSVTLPAASTRKRYHIKKKDSTANAITISAAGADTIEGSASKSLATQYKSYTLYSDGSTTWYIEAST